MKRISILFAIIAFAFISACVGNSLESKAKGRYKKLPTDALGWKTASLDFSDEDVLFSDDSICVMQFTVNAKNYSGESGSVRMEYFILRTPDREDSPSHLIEASYALDDERGSLLDNEVIHYETILNERIPEDKAERSKTLRMLAILLTMDRIHTVPE